jgi:hypothetical protein
MKKQKTKVQKESENQRILREHSKDIKSCLINFLIPNEITCGASSVAVADSFNNGDPHSHLMEKQANVNFRLDVALEPDREYKFRYIINGSCWENVHNADRYYLSDFSSCDN